MPVGGRLSSLYDDDDDDHIILCARTHTHTKRVLLHLYTIRNLLPVFLLFYIVCVCVCAYRLVIK